MEPFNVMQFQTSQAMSRSLIALLLLSSLGGYTPKRSNDGRVRGAFPHIAIFVIGDFGHPNWKSGCVLM